MITSPRLAAVLVFATLTSGCALRSPSISELRDNPGRYQHRTVSVRGVVTTSWGVPLVPVRFYKVDDGTGEVTVVSRSSRFPTRGAEVTVSGRLDEVAVLSGEPLGLHLKEEHLRIRRR
jgi:hypothetical protein